MFDVPRDLFETLKNDIVWDEGYKTNGVGVIFVHVSYYSFLHSCFRRRRQSEWLMSDVEVKILLWSSWS